MGDLKAGMRIARVIECRCCPGKKRIKLWAFGIDDLMDLYGINRQSVHRAMADGRLDPTDLHSVVAFANRNEAIGLAKRERGKRLAELGKPYRFVAGGTEN